MRVRFMGVLLLLLVPSSSFGEERYLLPAFIDVPGAHGSAWISELRLFVPGSTPLMIRGLDPACATLCPPLQFRFSAQPGITYTNFAKTGSPGLVVKTPQDADVRFNLRVRDTSRNDLSAGTEIPVVPEAALRKDGIFLLGVPPEGVLYRNHLRVYAFAPATVRVTYLRESDNFLLQQQTLALNFPAASGAAAEFYPAFAESANFPIAASPVRITVEPIGTSDGIWAFVSTTNNATQEVTLVTP